MDTEFELRLKDAAETCAHMMTIATAGDLICKWAKVCSARDMSVGGWQLVEFLFIEWGNWFMSHGRYTIIGSGYIGPGP